MITETVLIQVIIAVAAVATTYLTVKYKDKVIKPKADKQADRMENVFDGYERLIARLDAANLQLERTVNRLEKELIAARTDLAEQKELNRDLKDQLKKFKKAYTDRQSQA